MGVQSGVQFVLCALSDTGLSPLKSMQAKYFMEKGIRITIGMVSMVIPWKQTRLLFTLSVLSKLQCSAILWNIYGTSAWQWNIMFPERW